ncbi:MAG: hypothetical protein LUD07_01210 [Clostridiales bacterium]|nr:hypothetical protein [Clostridiales bacterium]
MEGTALAVFGFVGMAILLSLLCGKRIAPCFAFTGISAVTSVILMLSGTFTMEEMEDGIRTGISEVSVILTLYIFSEILYETVKRTGIFERLVCVMIKGIGRCTVTAAVVSCLLAMAGCVLAMAGHLDDGGTIALLITIPVMLPVYKHLKMRATTLLLICAAAIGVMSLVPWKEAMMCLALVFERTPAELVREAAPMQAVGVASAVGTALIWGGLEKKKESEKMGGFLKKASQGEEPMKFRSRIREMLVTVFTIVSVGVFLGIFENAGIMEEMVTAFLSLIPACVNDFAPLLIGICSVPLALVSSPDAYISGLLPALTGKESLLSTVSAETMTAMMICRNCAALVSPVAPVVYLGLRLAGVDVRDHICSSFFWLWGVSLICLISGIVVGMIQF